MSIEKLERALSVRQPFAHFIIMGEKRFEYRSRRCHIRGRVYVYAGKNVAELDGDDWDLPRGLIIGSVEIVDCRVADPRGFAWILANPRRYDKPLRQYGIPQPGFFKPRLR